MMNSIELRGNKFETRLEIDILNDHIIIPDAKIDTGCKHSLISYDTLNAGVSKEVLFKRALISKNYRLATGIGVESNKSDVAWLNELIKAVNENKENHAGLSITEIEQEIRHSLKTSEPGILEKAFKSPNIRVQVAARNIEINGINVGDAYIRIGLNNNHKVLIGMYLLKRMHMVMIRDKKNTYLDLLDRNIADVGILKQMTNLAYGPDEVLKMIDN